MPMEKEPPDERKWYLVARQLSDQLTPAETEEWQDLMRDDVFRNEFALLQKHWHVAGELPYGRIDSARDWHQVLEKIRLEEKVRGGSFVWLKYAAAVAALVVCSFALWTWTSSSRVPMFTTVEAPAGARTAVRLPDSSRVWLNAGSRITFNQDFGDDNRDVMLEGEAFFDVEESDVRFQVHTHACDIAVLGTAFNVRAYREDGAITTSLIRGSLQIRLPGVPGKTGQFVLAPNDRLTVDTNATTADDRVHFERNIDAVAEMEWKDGWLTTRGESLDALAKKIERLYNVKIQFEDEALKDFRYTGRIQQFSLEQVLNALSLTSPIEFVIHEKTVTLRENRSARSKYRKP